MSQIVDKHAGHNFPKIFHLRKLELVSVGLTGETLRGLIAGLDRELETLLSEE